MSGESPGGSGIQTGGRKCFCQEGSQFVVDLVNTVVNICTYCVQCLKVVDFIDRRNNCSVHSTVAFQNCLVIDQAIAFIVACHTCNLAVIVQRQRFVCQMAVDCAVRQIINVILPCLAVCGTSKIEDRRCFVLCHLGLQGCIILTICCSKNHHFNTGLFCVSCCKLLPCCICFRLHVQVIYFTSAFCHCRYCRNHRSCHNCCQSHCRNFSHFHIILSFLTRYPYVT